MTDTPHHISDHAESANHWRQQAAEFRERANRAERVVEKARRVVGLHRQHAASDNPEFTSAIEADLRVALLALEERLAVYDAPDPGPVKGRCSACGSAVRVGELCEGHRGKVTNGKGGG